MVTIVVLNTKPGTARAIRPNSWPAKSRILPGLRALNVPTAIPITTPRTVPIKANSIVTGSALAVSEAMEMPVEYE